MTNILFEDLVLLQVIRRYNETYHKNPSHDVIIEGFNNFLLFNDIQEDRAIPITSNYRFQRMVTKLRGLDLMFLEGKYRITEDAENLFFDIPHNPMLWAVSVPYVNHRPDWSNAIYLR